MTQDHNNLKAEKRNVEIQGYFKFNKMLNLSRISVSPDIYSFPAAVLHCYTEGEEEMEEKRMENATSWPISFRRFALQRLMLIKIFGTKFTGASL